MGRAHETSTNQQLFEKNLYNLSSHYEKGGFTATEYLVKLSTNKYFPVDTWLLVLFDPLVTITWSMQKIEFEPGIPYSVYHTVCKCPNHYTTSCQVFKF